MQTMTLGHTFHLIRSDFRRMAALMGMGKSLGRRVFLALTPSIVGLAIYRVSHWCYVKHLRFLAWPLWLFNTYLTGLDIVPSAVIGHSCFIGHPVGSVITGKLGDKVVMFGSVLIGGGLGHGDVGAGDGLPVIGNEVVIGIRATILGPITIGDGAMVGACALVVTDIAPGAAVGNRPSRPIAGERIDYEAIAGLKAKPAANPAEALP
jgi:serine O-acetyltransferase